MDPSFEKAVLVAGEALVDFLSNEPGKPLDEAVTFAKRLGGAPLNVAVGLRRLGVPVAFLGKLGKDPFGAALFKEMRKEGINVDYTLESASHDTLLAFARYDAQGRPEFWFHGDDAADFTLTPKDVERIKPGQFSLLHFGSVMLTKEPARSAYLELFERFVAASVPVSFDPNVRPALIQDKVAYVMDLERVFEGATLIKMSDEDLAFFSGKGNSLDALVGLPKNPEAVTVLTRGKKGAIALSKGMVVRRPAFPIEPIETCGCGDAFMAGLIARLGNGLDHPGNISKETLEGALDFAQASAVVVASRVGAAEAMPSLTEIQAFLKLS